MAIGQLAPTAAIPTIRIRPTAAAAREPVDDSYYLPWYSITSRSLRSVGFSMSQDFCRFRHIGRLQQCEVLS
jgi:hypothetical protein